MKNAWKGLVVGALTGMAGGVVLDLGVGSRRKAAAVMGEVADRAPGVIERIPEAASHVAQRTVDAVRDTAGAVRDADLPGTARDLAHKAQHAAGGGG